jgi:hypothetical protein
MGIVIVDHTIHHARVDVLLRSPSSGVAKDMLRRGLRVQAQARRNLSGGGGYPRRIRSSLLRNTIYARPIVRNRAPGCAVGSSVRYAMLVHNGTGLYGPRHDYIYPKRGRFLVFTPKGGGVVFARRVAGMKPNPFLKNALPAARY